MKYTLLDIVQTVLSSLDSDEVNSIIDTPESMQVAVIARTSYLNIATRGNLAETKTLFSLDASDDPTIPILMYRPQNIQNVDWVKYNRVTDTDPTVNYQLLTYLPVEDFFDQMHLLDSTNPDVEQATLEIGDDHITLLYTNNKGPMYWTSYNDEIVLFDSYDALVDGTLQKDKTLCYGEESMGFELEDDFIPDLDEKQHALWLNDTKALAWAEIKQAQHARAEREVQKGWVNLSITKRGTPTHTSELDRLPSYGRRGAGSVTRVTKRNNSW